jgi:hypothetical protein
VTEETEDKDKAISTAIEDKVAVSSTEVVAEEVSTNKYYQLFKFLIDVTAEKNEAQENAERSHERRC